MSDYVEKLAHLSLSEFRDQLGVVLNQPPLDRLDLTTIVIELARLPLHRLSFIIIWITLIQNFLGQVNGKEF